MKGTIKRIIQDKGFGFISTESGPDIFFHASNVLNRVFENLQENDVVEFEEGPGKKEGSVQALKVKAIY